MALTSTEEALVRQLIDQQAAILSLAGSESTIISKLGATKVTIADLTSASVIGDADLFLIRQGTTEKNVAGAVVKALASASVAGATETTSGIVELATVAETQTGTDNSRAVHPAGLASLTATETRSGLIELATVAEAQALTDAVRALSPARLASAFGGSNQSLATSGYQKLPSGLIFQWGSITPSSGGTASVTFPVAFPTAFRNALVSVGGGNNTVNTSAETTTGMTVSTYTGVTGAALNGQRVLWMAIGY